MSDTVLEPAHSTTDGSHDKFAHYVDHVDVMEAFVHGVAIIALCGKIWVPTRDGDGFPLCHECDKIFNELT